MRAFLFALLSVPASAHDGHGAPSVHLHGWDSTATLALVAAAAVALWWFTKGRK